MIAYIKGKLTEKSPTEVVIETNGVGYLLSISLHTYSSLPDQEEIKLFTFLHIKEDAHTLYGFFDKAERELFKLLISVSGIGPGTARTMLSSIAPTTIIQAIANGDNVTIQSAKGVGLKTAQRVIIDLKDKISKIYNIEMQNEVISTTNRNEALEALEVLGFVRKTAEKVIDKIIKEDPQASVETLIKKALKNL
ncbi:Holliday junction branch migration protein RuvA [Flavobacterium agricola]|uniref:Holliday junction branch migration complex subunit RuvA n=1 Tax=Flavobacterium agricola TaxID=2870839 RepID=A0ABY6LZ96_9FLAO|nr:Holliday junction branch migration protein RuvA [Flavobacterium agricola]UYW00765.1 Holliday junction branch migration protein RuvA [Flavobacterium agricola]